MRQEYIVDPSDELANYCSKNGMFLEDDYYMAMSHNEIPNSYWDRVEAAESSKRKIVIIGSHEIPMLITKSAFIARTLAKPEKITVKISGKAENILLEKMFEKYKDLSDCEYNVYQSAKDELISNGAWIRDIEEATDVIVYGGLDTLSFFNMEPTEERKVWFHRPKFSFGVVSKDCLENEDNLAGMVGDFISYFGEGALSPQFYITVGKLTNDQMAYIADCIKNEQDIIKEFRAKLPLSKKTMIINNSPVNNFVLPNIKQSTFDKPEFLTPLFGDVRLVEVDDYSDVDKFVQEYEGVVSTIALEEETMGHYAAGWEADIPRFCDIGSMQFPHFYEPYDDIDDMEIYDNNFEDYYF